MKYWKNQGNTCLFVDVGAGLGAEKPGRFTRDGAVEHNLEIEDGREFPEPLGDFQFGAVASWEVDIWRKSCAMRGCSTTSYLAANEGRNFLVSNLIAEIAQSYYELTGIDNLLEIINNNAAIQEEALRKVKFKKKMPEANQLAVNRFEAQLLKTGICNTTSGSKSWKPRTASIFWWDAILQLLSEIQGFMILEIDSIQAGIPARLLQNRPDIRQAEYHCKPLIWMYRWLGLISIRVWTFRLALVFRHSIPAFIESGVDSL
jgi:multidrug efflux system outer membrane protein